MKQQTTSSNINYMSHQQIGEDTERMFESSFTDMSYQMFNVRFPEMAQSVVTFNVIESEIEKGSAVGAFSLEIDSDIFFVPVVMVESKLKPMELIYSKRLDKFMPFNQDWIQITLSSGDQSIGTAAPSNEPRFRQEDLTSMMQAPMTANMGGGQFGMGGMGAMTRMASTELDMPNFTEFLKHASNNTKEEFAELFRSNTDLFKFAATNFGTNEIQEAFTRTKVAEETASPVDEEVLEVITQETPEAKIREIFTEEELPGVAEKLVSKGFVAKDKRDNKNVVYETETELKLEEVNSSGFYKICKLNGEMVPALVIVEPITKSNGYAEVSCSSSGGRKARVNKLIILKDGGYFKTKDHMMAVPSTIEECEGEFTKSLKSRPVLNKPMIMLKQEGGSFRSTHPMMVNKITTDKDDMTKYVELDSWAVKENKEIKAGSSRERCDEVNSQFISVSQTPKGNPYRIENAKAVMFDKKFVPVSLKEKVESADYLRDSTSILFFIREKAAKVGSSFIKVASRGAGEFSINGKAIGDIVETTEKIARDLSVDFDSVFDKVASIKRRGESVDMIIMDRTKTASIFAGTPGTQMSPGMVQEQAMGQEQVDPAAQESMIAPQGQMQQQQMDPQQQQQMMMQQQQQMQQQPQQQMPQEGMMQQEQMAQQPMDPSMMQEGMGQENPELYNLGAIKAIAQDPSVRELISQYVPTIEKAMDNTSRLLLSLWVEGSKHIEELGEEKFREIENAARNTLKEIGNLLLLVQKSSDLAPIA